MRLLREALGSTGGKVIFAIAILLLIFEAWITLSAPGKIDSRIPALAINGRADIVVELNFPPESYHFLYLQKFGRTAGSSGNTVTLKRVPLSNVRKLARAYWIKSIKPMNPNGSPGGQRIPLKPPT